MTSGARITTITSQVSLHLHDWADLWSDSVSIHYVMSLFIQYYSTCSFVAQPAVTRCPVCGSSPCLYSEEICFKNQQRQQRQQRAITELFTATITAIGVAAVFRAMMLSPTHRYKHEDTSMTLALYNNKHGVAAKGLREDRQVTTQRVESSSPNFSLP